MDYLHSTALSRLSETLLLMLRLFENHTTALRQVFGQRILEGKLSSTVTTLIACVGGVGEAH